MPQVPFLDLKREIAPIAEELRAAASRVIDSGWYVLGEELRAFEREVAAFEGRRHAIGVANGLDAIRLVLQAHGVGPGDEVIVPAMTFVATALAAMQVGATVTLADVEPSTLLIDAASVARVLTRRTRAVIPVHLYGQMADIAALRRVLPSDVVIVEDAAQAQGARRDGKSPGSATLAATHSYYPGKNLGALGDAGAVLCDDEDLAARLARLRNYGQAEKYLHTDVGLNSRLDELQAAFLRVRLRHLAGGTARRVRIANRYVQGLAGAPGLRLLDVPDGSTPVWHLFPVRHPRRDALASLLAERHVSTLVHYPRAIHQQPALAGVQGDSVPVAEIAARELLSLPMGTALTDAEVDLVISATLDACRSLA